MAPWPEGQPLPENTGPLNSSWLRATTVLMEPRHSLPGEDGCIYTATLTSPCKLSTALSRGCRLSCSGKTSAVSEPSLNTMLMRQHYFGSAVKQPCPCPAISHSLHCMVWTLIVGNWQASSMWWSKTLNPLASIWACFTDQLCWQTWCKFSEEALHNPGDQRKLTNPATKASISKNRIVWYFPYVLGYLWGVMKYSTSGDEISWTNP